MTYQIAYGIDTESIEDPSQIVLLDLPTECEDMDSEDLESWINDNWPDLHSQPLVGWEDVRDSFILAMRGERLTNETIARVVITASDAIDNNS